jgi:DNA (cytosine-5)-methyltransferase 1
MSFTSIELCAGAGGQALGLEQAGFQHVALFENDPYACATLRLNRPHWNIYEHDLFVDFDFSKFKEITLLAGGLPCPPFSVAGKQLGENDDRNLFTKGVEIASKILPRAIMFENVKGILNPAFAAYRLSIQSNLESLGYSVFWKLINASDFGVPQLRPRVIMVALRKDVTLPFIWPQLLIKPLTVGETLIDLMGLSGWKGAKEWAEKANYIAPTIVGGSKKHGGPDLGPTRAKTAWLELGVEGRTIANESPHPNHEGMVRLTVPMVARLQGFPDDWKFYGRKTQTYRQVGNAFPPPVAKAVAESIIRVLSQSFSKEEAA